MAKRPDQQGSRRSMHYVMLFLICCLLLGLATVSLETLPLSRNPLADSALGGVLGAIFDPGNASADSHREELTRLYTLATEEAVNNSIKSALASLPETITSEAAIATFMAQSSAQAEARISALIEEARPGIESSLYAKIDNALDTAMAEEGWGQALQEKVLYLRKEESASSHSIAASAPLSPAATAENVLAPPLVPKPPPPAPPPSEKVVPLRFDVRNCTASTAVTSGFHKEWCGAPRSPGCSTDFEREYVRNKKQEMAQGLAALRKPGCYPHGVTFGVHGIYRSGSTLLFNIVRSLATLGAQEGLMSGFTCRDPSASGVGVEGHAAASCSIVCKDHELHAISIPVILMSRRAPVESLCSRKLSGMWCRLRQEGRKEQAKADEKLAYEKLCRSNATVEAEEAQAQCRKLMSMQAEIYAKRHKIGLSVAYDMYLSDYTASPQTQIREIFKAMGICQEAYENPALIEFAMAVGTHLAEAPGDGSFQTLMHPTHPGKQREIACATLADAMRGDDECREWMEGNGAASSNAILRKRLSELEAAPKAASPST